jgi:transcriptional regulator with XRE-family HTH domain
VPAAAASGSHRSRELFARNLRAARRRAGLSQERLSELARLHRTEISLLERGERDPRLTTVFRLADALGLQAAALLAPDDELSRDR